MGFKYYRIIVLLLVFTIILLTTSSKVMAEDIEIKPVSRRLESRYEVLLASEIFQTQFPEFLDRDYLIICDNPNYLGYLYSTLLDCSTLNKSKYGLLSFIPSESNRKIILISTQTLFSEIDYAQVRSFLLQNVITIPINSISYDKGVIMSIYVLSLLLLFFINLNLDKFKTKVFLFVIIFLINLIYLTFLNTYGEIIISKIIDLLNAVPNELYFAFILYVPLIFLNSAFTIFSNFIINKSELKYLENKLFGKTLILLVSLYLFTFVYKDEVVIFFTLGALLPFLYSYYINKAILPLNHLIFFAIISLSILLIGLIFNISNMSKINGSLNVFKNSDIILLPYKIEKLNSLRIYGPPYETSGKVFVNDYLYKGFNKHISQFDPNNPFTIPSVETLKIVTAFFEDSVLRDSVMNSEIGNFFYMPSNTYSKFEINCSATAMLVEVFIYNNSERINHDKIKVPPCSFGMNNFTYAFENTESDSIFIEFISSKYLSLKANNVYGTLILPNSVLKATRTDKYTTSINYYFDSRLSDISSSNTLYDILNFLGELGYEDVTIWSDNFGSSLSSTN